MDLRLPDALTLLDRTPRVPHARLADLAPTWSGTTEAAGRLLGAVICGALAGVVVTASAQQAPFQPAPRVEVSSPCTDTATVVARAVAYVERYGEQLGSVIATENYQQELLGEVELSPFTPPPITIIGGRQVQATAPMSDPVKSTLGLRSSFLFVRLAEGPGWVGFRDVLEVNGRRVAETARAAPALDAAGESAIDRWRRLSEASARYNLGSITRTLNVPTFALLVLQAANAQRFAFTAAGNGGGAGNAVCDLSFQEADSPTIVRSAVGGDLPASGRFRIELASGRVLESELVAGNAASGVASKAVVRYALDRKLQLWVPREMREDYAAKSGERLQCFARYADYRRAEVAVRVRPDQ